MTDTLKYMTQGSGEKVDWSKVPEHIRGGLDRYITDGIPPGSFVTAVLKNDLARAIRFGDDDCQRALADIYRFLYWNAPAFCFGDTESFDKWIRHQGLRGK